VFLSKGARVVMLNRSPEKSTAAIEALKAEFGADADVSFIRMDLAVLGSVREAAAEVLEQVPHIDALICVCGRVRGLGHLPRRAVVGSTPTRSRRRHLDGAGFLLWCPSGSRCRLLSSA